MQYRIKLTPDDNGTFLVTMPDFPEVITYGDNEAHALAMAMDALEEALAARINAGEDIPLPRAARRGQKLVPVSATAQAKVRLINEVKARGLRKADLARKLNMKRPQIDRLLDVRYQSHIKQLEALAAALGKHLSIDLCDSAA